MLKLFITNILLIVGFCSIRAEVELVDDTDLMHLLTNSDNVVVLFTKNNCENCESFEKLVEKAEDKFKEHLDASTVKAHNSQLLPIYNPNKQESLIYFRKGIPLLYYGEINENDILQAFTENREPIVKELSDENFEHLTQAASGSTTGDWLIFFTSNDCQLCHRLYAIWEAVGSKLKQRLNLARVNRLEAGASTAKRFKIAQSPAFIFIRHGKYYVLNPQNFIPKTFIEFAEGGYLKVKGNDVPQVTNQINDVYENLKQISDNNPNIFKFGIAFLILLSGFIVLTKYFAARNTRIVVEKSKKSG